MFAYSIFGGILFLSLFEVKLIKENFLLVKSTKGKGIFCLFISSTFLVTGASDNLIITVATAAIGAGFLFIGFIKVSKEIINRIYLCWDQPDEKIKL